VEKSKYHTLERLILTNSYSLEMSVPINNLAIQSCDDFYAHYLIKFDNTEFSCKTASNESRL